MRYKALQNLTIGGVEIPKGDEIPERVVREHGERVARGLKTGKVGKLREEPAPPPPPTPVKSAAAAEAVRAAPAPAAVPVERPAKK